MAQSRYSAESNVSTGGLVNSPVLPASAPSALQEYVNSIGDIWSNEYNRNRAATGDSRSFDSWLRDGLRSNSMDSLWQDPAVAAFVGSGSFSRPAQTAAPYIPAIADNAVTTFNQPEPTPSFFSEPAPHIVPQAVIDIVREFIGASNPPPSIAPTPEVLVAPSVTTNNVFAPVTNFFNYVTNIFFPSPPAPASNPVGQAGSIDGFLTPTNNSPLTNNAGFGSPTTPSSQKVGQVIDTAQSTPSGIPAQIAGVIRGLDIPGISGIKNDRALIIATLCAPLLGLLALWLIKKLFFRK